jgi:hypothetical protein
MTLFRALCTTPRTIQIWHEYEYKLFRDEQFYLWSFNYILSSSRVKIRPQNPGTCEVQVRIYLHHPHRISNSTIALQSKNQSYLFDYIPQFEYWQNSNDIIELPLHKFELHMSQGQLIAFLSGLTDPHSNVYWFLKKCDFAQMLKMIYRFLV